MPSIITFPPVSLIDNTLTDSTTNAPTSTSTITSIIMNTTIDIYNDNMIWDDPDLDYNLFESILLTSSSLSNTATTAISFDLDDELDCIDEILLNSTLVNNFIIPETNSSLDLWDFNDTSITLFSSNTTTIIEKDDDDWTIFNTTFELPITQFNHLSLDANLENDDIEDYLPLDFESNDDNDTSIISTTTTPTIIDLSENLTEPLFIYDIKDKNIKDQLLELFKPYPTLAIPPFSWMLNMMSQNKSKLPNSTTTISTTQSTSTIKPTTSVITTIKTTTTTTVLSTANTIFEYCKNKHCQHGGRLNSDCLCICLPAFTGDQCETGTILFYSDIFYIYFYLMYSTLRTRTSTYLYICTRT